MTNVNPAGSPAARWLRRLGLTGFAFFFVKGLLWLIVPVLIARGVFKTTTAVEAPPAANVIPQD